jgi:hypothetical protein
MGAVGILKRIMKAHCKVGGLCLFLIEYASRLYLSKISLKSSEFEEKLFNN